MCKQIENENKQTNIHTFMHTNTHTNTPTMIYRFENETTKMLNDKIVIDQWSYNHIDIEQYHHINNRIET